MILYPEGAAEALGFDLIRQRLAGHALSAPAAETLAELRPFGTADEARAELDRVREFADALRFDDPVPFAHVLDVRSVLQRLAPEGSFADPDELLALLRVLATVRLLRRYVTDRRAKYPALVAASEALVPQPDLEARLSNVIDDEGRVRDDASPELRRLRRLLVTTQNLLRERLLQELRHAIGQGWATEEQPTIRGGRMVIPVRAEAKRKVQGFVHDTSATGQTVYVEPVAVLDLNNEVRELEVAERREVERLLRVVADAVRERLPELRPAFAALVRLDGVQARARLALELDAHVPALTTDGTLDLRQARHPVLALRFLGTGRAVVPLTLRLDDDRRTLVITGPNAGGKSVAMKTVGLCALMAACGLPVPAAPGSTVAFFDRLCVDIGDAQSVEEDLSTFTSHVERLKWIVRAAAPGVLVLLDELGTGTDPAEGGALAQAVLERLTAAGARTIATTHIGALKAFAHHTEGVENGAMVFDQSSLAPTYRFTMGVPGSSYAFEIAQRTGLEPALLDRARALLGTRETALQDLILEFERRTRAAEQAERDAAAARDEADRIRRDYEERRRVQREERDRRRAEALQEAERIVKEANRTVERTIREIREGQAAREVTQAARTELAAFAEGVERQQRKVERRQPRKPRPAPGERAPLAVGDQVVLEDSGTSAEVVELRGKDAVIAVGTVRMRVPQDRLRRVGGRRAQQVQVRTTGPETSGLAALTASTRLDLRGQRVDEVQGALLRFLDAAVSANAERVEVLHGKGTGALRQTVRELLAKQPEVVDFEDAPWDEGGPGVTIVTLR